MSYQYQDEVVAAEDPTRDEVNLRLAGDTPHGGYTALVEAADRKGIDLTKPSEGDTVGRARLTAEGDVVEFCFPDEPFEDERLHSNVLGYLDGSARTLNALIETFEAADSAVGGAGHYLGRLAEAKRHLDDAFEEVDQDPDDVDAGAVLDLVSSAVDVVSEVRRRVSPELREFEIPEGIDTGVYDTLGGYVDYVHGDLLAAENYANRYAEASH